MFSAIIKILRSLVAPCTSTATMRKIVLDEIIITTNKVGGVRQTDRYVFLDGSYVLLPHGGIVNRGPGYMSTERVSDEV